MEVSSSEFEELGPNQQRAVTELTRMLAKSWGEGSVVIAPEWRGPVQFRPRRRKRGDDRWAEGI